MRFIASRFVSKPYIILPVMMFLSMLLIRIGYAIETEQARCLDIQLPAAECVTAAELVDKDIDALLVLAGELETSSQFEKAMVVYDIASKEFSDSKVVYQGLIRARAKWREQKRTYPVYINSEQHQQNQQSNEASEKRHSVTDINKLREDCFRLRWQEAQQACQSVIQVRPDDAAVLERSGDVHRGLGQVDKAMALYTRSARLNPGNLSIKRKMRALQNTVSKESPTPVSSEQSGGLSNQVQGQVRVSQDNLNNQSQRLNKVVKVDSRWRSLNNRNYHALIIGNNDYSDASFPDLLTAKADARKIATILKTKYGFQNQVLIDASRYDIMRAISDYRKKLTEHDKFVIYYAGHGVLDEVTQQGYWLPVDAENDNQANWISANDVINALTGINAKHALVIADSCFSGSLLRNSLGLDLDERDALLLRLDDKRSRTVMTSGGLEPVQDDGGGKHSVFANALLWVLEHNQGVLEAGKMFVQLRDRVVANAEQTPQYAPIGKAGHDGGDFIFVPR
ncbi:MAG: caspase family protein [Arenicella sp.]